MKIDTYSFGYMSIDGKGYSTDLIIYTDGSIKSSWWRKEGHRLYIEDLEKALDVGPEIVIIGTGANGMMKVGDETLNFLKKKCNRIIIEKTDKAVEFFNKLRPANSVVGLFHLTC